MSPCDEMASTHALYGSWSSLQVVVTSWCWVGCRYTVVRSGERRLYVPNSAFITREFMVVDDPEARSRHKEMDHKEMEAASYPTAATRGPHFPHAYMHGPDGHPRWMGAPPYDAYFMNGRCERDLFSQGVCVCARV